MATKKKAIKKAGKKTPKKGDTGKKPKGGRSFAVAAAPGADCLSMDDAISIVRDCLSELIGDAAEDIDFDTSISTVLPGNNQGSLQSLFACIKQKTKWKLDPRDFGDASLQDIADKLACVEVK
jgi:hypothetical protein